jgi:hypothetical protein
LMRGALGPASTPWASRSRSAEARARA